MTQRAHLSLPELEAALHDERPYAAHLSECADCAANLDGLRQVRALELERLAVEESNADCLDAAAIAALAAGSRMDESLWEHIAVCPRCSSLLKAAVEPRPELVSGFRPKWIWGALAAALAVAAGLAFLWPRPDPEALLAQAYTAQRPFVYRLPGRGYGPVRQERGLSRDRSAPLLEAPQLLTRAGAPALLKARAELLEGQYERAIELLSGAGGDPVDLACAFALRGDQENRKEDSARALELLLGAVRANGRDSRARFNLALVYERLSLVEEAIDAWRSYLELDSASEWAREARERLAELERIRRESSLRAARPKRPRRRHWPP